jgi:hypothetical protein
MKANAETPFADYGGRYLVSATAYWIVKLRWWIYNSTLIGQQPGANN